MQTVITPKGQRRYNAQQNMGQVLLQWAMFKQQKADKLEEQKLRHEALLDERKYNEEQQDKQFERKLKLAELEQSITPAKEGEGTQFPKLGKWYKRAEQDVEPEIGSVIPIQGFENQQVVYLGKNKDGSPKYQIATKKDGADKPPQYTPQQMVDDTRSFYSLKMKSMLDPEGGFVRPGQEEAYGALLDQMETDMYAISHGMAPSWFSDEPSVLAKLKNQLKAKQGTDTSLQMVVPNSELPKDLTPKRVRQALRGKQPGIYEVDGARFRWDGQMAIPYKKQIVTGKIPR